MHTPTIEKPTPAALATRYACEITDYDRLFPRGDNYSDLQWFSSFGSAYVRIANWPTGSKHPGHDVRVKSPYFYNENNPPTHEDLMPEIKIMPSEERPSTELIDVYVESEVYQKKPDGTLLVEYVGHSLCGSLRHTGALQWKQAAPGPEVSPTYVSSRQIVS